MRNKTIGFVLFWIAVVYMILIGFLASFPVRSAYRFSTFEEVNETIWAVTSPLFGLWATAIPIGAILAGAGLLIAVRAKRSHIWLFGLGIFSVLLIDILSRWEILPEPGHSPLLFGIGGGLIMGFFLIILWYWAKKYTTLRDQERSAAELQLAGYVFLIIGMWYLCGDLSRPFQRALSDQSLGSPVFTIVYLALGWLFLLLSHYKAAQLTADVRTQSSS
jgi:hypothetical protein